MPLIEYICLNCAEVWSSFQRISAKDSPFFICPRCGGKSVRKSENIEERSSEGNINKEIK